MALAAVLALTSVTYVSFEKASAAKTSAATAVAYADVQPIFARHCMGCHSAHPANPAFASPPLGVLLDSYGHASAVAARIKTVAVDAEIMPLGNTTGMTADERHKLGAWIAGGAQP